MRFSHANVARKTFALLGSALSSVTKTLAARRTPPVTGLLPVASSRQTRCNLHVENGGSEGSRTTACPLPAFGLALPPQEIRALLQILQHHTLSLVIILPHFITAFSWSSSLFYSSDQSSRSSRPDRSSYHWAWQMQTVAFQPQSQLILSCTSTPLSNICSSPVPSPPSSSKFFARGLLAW